MIAPWIHVTLHTTCMTCTSHALTGSHGPQDSTGARVHCASGPGHAGWMYYSSTKSHTSSLQRNCTWLTQCKCHVAYVVLCPEGPHSLNKEISYMLQEKSDDKEANKGMSLSLEHIRIATGRNTAKTCTTGWTTGTNRLKCPTLAVPRATYSTISTSWSSIHCISWIIM